MDMSEVHSSLTPKVHRATIQTNTIAKIIHMMKMVILVTTQMMNNGKKIVSMSSQMIIKEMKMTIRKTMTALMTLGISTTDHKVGPLDEEDDINRFKTMNHRMTMK